MRTLLFCFLIFGSDVAHSFSRWPPGSYFGSFDVSFRKMMTSQNEKAADAVRLGVNLGPYFVAFENALPETGDQNYFRFILGAGNSAMQGATLFEEFRPVLKFNFIDIKTRRGPMTSYSGIEVGLSREIGDGVGAYITISADYPGLMLFPAIDRTKKPNSLYDDRDGLMTYLNIGFVWGGPPEPRIINCLGQNTSAPRADSTAYNY